MLKHSSPPAERPPASGSGRGEQRAQTSTRRLGWTCSERTSGNKRSSMSVCIPAPAQEAETAAHHVLRGALLVGHQEPDTVLLVDVAAARRLQRNSWRSVELLLSAAVEPNIKNSLPTFSLILS